MIGNETKTQGSPKTVWATTGAPKHLQRRDNPSGVGTHEGLRSPRVDKTIQGQSEDDWCEWSCKLVARPLNGNAKNQRRVRYFGFEAAHD
jgi:hypothetical protein